ncbi:MAG: CrcB family protein [Dermabacter sp.]|nr:CrcB family protein [Dermabacter sp.]
MSVLFVMLGGALGAACRYLLTFAPFLRSDDEDGAVARLPWPTFAANVLASFILGVIVRWAGSGTELWATSLIAFAVVGFCGALSTMSTFALELMVLVRRRATVTALGYLTLSLGASLAALWLGLVVAS